MAIPSECFPSWGAELGPSQPRVPLLSSSPSLAVPVLPWNVPGCRGLPAAPGPAGRKNRRRNRRMPQESAQAAARRPRSAPAGAGSCLAHGLVSHFFSLLLFLAGLLFSLLGFFFECFFFPALSAGLPGTGTPCARAHCQNNPTVVFSSLPHRGKASFSKAVVSSCSLPPGILWN